MGRDYQFVTEWRVPGTLEEVKEVLGDGRSLPRWWPSVYLRVIPRQDGPTDQVGCVMDLYTKGWLPYTLQWSLTISEPMSDAGFALSAAGDLNEPADGPSSRTALR